MTMADKRTDSVAQVAGIEIPPLAIPISTTLVVAAALANKDFEPVHHDRDHVRREGLPDIMMNTVSSSGIAARYVTYWAGPKAVVTRLSKLYQSTRTCRQWTKLTHRSKGLGSWQTGSTGRVATFHSHERVRRRAGSPA